MNGKNRMEKISVFIKPSFLSHISMEFSLKIYCKVFGSLTVNKYGAIQWNFQQLNNIFWGTKLHFYFSESTTHTAAHRQRHSFYRRNFAAFFCYFGVSLQKANNKNRLDDVFFLIFFAAAQFLMAVHNFFSAFLLLFRDDDFTFSNRQISSFIDF